MFTDSLTDLIRKDFKTWDAVKFMVADTYFPKSRFFAWKLKLCNW